MSTRWLLAIAILGFSFAAAYWGGLAARAWRQPTQPQELVEGLAVTAADLDMGEVWEKKDAVWRLPIRNQTASSITIHKFDTSCGCTAIEPRTLSIPPGETATIKLTIDLTHRLPAEYGLDRRPFAVSIRPLTPGAHPKRPSWQVHGTVLSRVTLDTQTVHFGDQPIHGQSPVTRRVLASVHVPCQRLQVTVNPFVASVTVNRRASEEARFEITIAPNPSLSPGAFQTDAQIDVVTPTGECLPGVTLPIAGTMQPEVRLLPARVLLEPKPVGETAEAVVTLQAPPDAKTAVDHIEIDDPGLRVEPAVIEGIPAGRAYRVRQQVAKEGEQVSKVRFIIRKPDHKLITLPVEVSYRGEAVKKTATNKTERVQP